MSASDRNIRRSLFGAGSVITRHCRWRGGAPRHGMFFADAAELCIEKCLAGKRTRVEIEQLIRGKLVPKIGQMPLTALSHDDIVVLLRESPTGRGDMRPVA